MILHSQNKRSKVSKKRTLFKQNVGYLTLFNFQTVFVDNLSYPLLPLSVWQPLWLITDEAFCVDPVNFSTRIGFCLVKVRILPFTSVKYVPCCRYDHNYRIIISVLLFDLWWIH